MEYGLIGEKLEHSYSPLLHACFGEYDYRLYPMDLPALRETLQKRAFRGLNITIPYKTMVLPYCDAVSDAVKMVGSANTLWVQDGKLFADNTDLQGMIYMLGKGGIRLSGRKVIILGSGGTSLTAQAACKVLQARETVVISRSGPIPYSDLYAHHADGEILINTTPVGMYPKTLISPVDLSRLPRLQGVADVIYNPAQTALLLDAKERGLRCMDGLWMLASQASYAAQNFLGKAIPEEKIEQAYETVRRKCMNLVLIGMPGSGKSTLGAIAAQKLGRPLIDIDAEIEKEYGPIPLLFRDRGESTFREMESEKCRAFGKESGLVIAAGGGAVLRKENVRALLQNGVTAWIKRPLEALATEGRPLSNGQDAVKKMWEIREPIYRACASFEVDNSGWTENAIRQMMEGFDEAVGCKRTKP